jgi:hypothetical protein
MAMLTPLYLYRMITARIMAGDIVSEHEQCRLYELCVLGRCNPRDGRYPAFGCGGARRRPHGSTCRSVVLAICTEQARMGSCHPQRPTTCENNNAPHITIHGNGEGYEEKHTLHKNAGVHS